jgi:hypothetical protein
MQLAPSAQSHDLEMSWRSLDHVMSNQRIKGKPEPNLAIWPLVLPSGVTEGSQLANNWRHRWTLTRLLPPPEKPNQSSHGPALRRGAFFYFLRVRVSAISVPVLPSVGRGFESSSRQLYP